MKKAIYFLASIISLSTLSFLLTIHNIGKSGSYTYALHDFIGGYVALFISLTVYCLYKHFKEKD